MLICLDNMYNEPHKDIKAWDRLTDDNFRMADNEQLGEFFARFNTTTTTAGMSDAEMLRWAPKKLNRRLYNAYALFPSNISSMGELMQMLCRVDHLHGQAPARQRPNSNTPKANERTNTKERRSNRNTD